MSEIPYSHPLRRKSQCHGRLEGARNIPFEELGMYKKYLPKDKLYLLYCDRGSSSLLAAKELGREGIRAATLVGGIQAVLQK